MQMQAYLDQEIKKICPIQGISFGSLMDKRTWIIHFDQSSTIDQQEMALEFMKNFTWSDELQKQQNEQEKIEKYKYDLVMRKGYVDYKQLKPDAKFIDYIEYLESIQI